MSSSSPRPSTASRWSWVSAPCELRASPQRPADGRHVVLVNDPLLLESRGKLRHSLRVIPCRGPRRDGRCGWRHGVRSGSLRPLQRRQDRRTVDDVALPVLVHRAERRRLGSRAVRRCGPVKSIADRTRAGQSGPRGSAKDRLSTDRGRVHISRRTECRPSRPAPGQPQRPYMARVAAISVRVEAVVKDALEAAAKEDGRTLSQYVERLVMAHLKSSGRLAE